jgi:hypothetical protein
MNRQEKLDRLKEAPGLDQGKVLLKFFALTADREGNRGQDQPG